MERRKEVLEWKRVRCCFTVVFPRRPFHRGCCLFWPRWRRGRLGDLRPRFVRIVVHILRSYRYCRKLKDIQICLLSHFLCKPRAYHLPFALPECPETEIVASLDRWGQSCFCDGEKDFRTKTPFSLQLLASILRAVSSNVKYFVDCIGTFTCPKGALTLSSKVDARRVCLVRIRQVCVEQTAISAFLLDEFTRRANSSLKFGTLLDSRSLSCGLN
jgi:hypothetical protein